MVAVIFILIIAIIWMACFLAFNDLMLPSRTVRKYRNALCVFAHMDDETVLAGGIMSKLIKQGSKVTLMILTKGEKGNDARKADSNLPAIRRAELSNVLEILSVRNLIHKKYGDETLTSKKAALKKDIEAAVRSVKPDLVVTFDMNGWYGHPDHIACAEAVTEVVKKHKNLELWYAVRPEAVNRAARLVAKMRPGSASLSSRTPPECKVYIGGALAQKINAIYQYQSQMSALRPGITVGPFPMWFFMSAQPYEYIIQA